jgi:hypothetical protein
MPTQGVAYNTVVLGTLVPAWYEATQAFQLHLFVSDSTPAVTDDPLADYTEAFGVNYTPLNVSGSFLQTLSVNPPLAAIIGAEFDDVGPLTPGSDTVYGWWIDWSGGSAPTALFGGRFESPVVLNAAGQSLIFDQIQLPMHDCNTVAFQQATLLDPWFQLPPVTGTPPNNFEYVPIGGDWTFGGGVNGNGGISGAGSAYTPPNIFPGTFQFAFVQQLGSLEQELFVPAGDYQIAVIAAQRAFASSQSVQVTLGSTTVGTISGWPQAWQLWSSSSFTITTSSNLVLKIQGLVSPPTDATLFIAHIELVPWPHL